MDPINPWLDSAEVRRLAERLLIPHRDPGLSVRDPGFDAAFIGYDAPSPQPAPPPQSAPVPQSAQPAQPAQPAPAQPAPAAQPFQPAPATKPSQPAPPTQSAQPTPATPPVFSAAPAAEPARQAAPPPAPPPQDDPLSPPPLPPRPLPPSGNTSERGLFLDRVKRFRDWMRDQFSATGVFILDREGSVIFDESGHGRLHFMARSLALASRRPGSTAGNVHVKVGAGATFEVIPVETAYGCLVLGAVVPQTLSPTAVAAVMEALAMTAAPTDS